MRLLSSDRSNRNSTPSPYTDSKCSPIPRHSTKKQKPNPLQNLAFSMVEIGGLEPPAPYMRSKRRSKIKSRSKRKK